MKLLLNKILLLFSLLGLLLVFQISQAADSPDAIAIRVMPNTDHLTPLAWYNQNVNIKGAPQALVVDGYEAVRDGRTVYVNAANLSENTDQATVYTNIYIISYNQDAEGDTQDIFGQLLSYWKFNTELVARTGTGICLPGSGQTCDVATGCTGQFADYSCEAGTCVKKCLLSSDCSNGQYCDSAKAKLIRDVKRMSDLREMNLVVGNYQLVNKQYPPLPSGSYLPDKTISVWPSWNETLGPKVGYKLPLDPVNRLGKCADNFDKITCWDENTKTFATNLSNPVLPAGSLAYVYIFDAKGARYKLCTNFESPFKGFPAQHRCNVYISTSVAPVPKITLGGFSSKSNAPFKDYILVQSDTQINWNTLNLIPDASWTDWYNRGWRWNAPATGLKVEKVPGADENIRALTAQLVKLPGKDYDIFNLTVEVSDIFGNKGSATGQIKICNPVTCADRNAQCGHLDDGCGGILLCGTCTDPLPDCVNNQCIKL